MTAPLPIDSYARERTELANERTFLAYVRTAVSIAALGIVMLHFMDDQMARIFGILMLLLGALIFALGLWRFRVEQYRLRNP